MGLPPRVPVCGRGRPRGSRCGQGGRSLPYYTVHYEPNNVFALTKADTLYLMAFKNETDARAVAFSVEHHVTSLESWPEMKLRDGLFRLYGEGSAASSALKDLEFLTVRRWARRDDLLCFAAAASLNLGISSFVRRHSRDAYLMPFDAVPIQVNSEFYSHVFEGLYDW